MAAGKGDDTSRGTPSANSYGRTPLCDITNKKRVIGGGVEMQKNLKMSGVKKRRKEPCKKPATGPIIIQNAGQTRLDGEIMDLSSDEEEQYDSRALNAPNVYGLNKHDYFSIEQKGIELRGSCVQAVIEVIHGNTELEEITSVNTDFYPYLLKGKLDEAKSLLHPDNRCTENSQRQWNTSIKRRATANSRMLLIPCHLVEKDKVTKQEMKHWILTVRIRTDNNKHRFLIFDSIGIKAGRKRMKMIKANMMKVNLTTKEDHWEAMNLRPQTERECGIRTVTYMLKFQEWAKGQLQSIDIVRRIKEVVQNEKSDPANLAVKYRKELSELLRNTQMRMGGTV